jgi:hypothetical protein
MNSTRRQTINPRYPSAAGLWLRAVTSGLLQRGHAPRSFQADVRPLVQQLTPPLRVSGEEHIPPAGPCLLLTNHYYRPGFDAWWITIAISAALPIEVHWVTTAVKTYPGQKRGLIMRPLSRFTLRQVEKAYGFFAMPAMPPDPAEAGQRADVVRRVVSYVRQDPCPVIGLAPEGRDILEGTLGWPPPGGGRFVQQLARLGLRLFPVGIFEEDGALHLNFGPSFDLCEPPAPVASQVDRSVARQVMLRIAQLLPPRMWGEFVAENQL